MGHTQTSNKKIVSRVRKLQGQLEGIVRGLDAGEDCFHILQTAAACRGSFTGLFLELLEDHIHSHVADAKNLQAVKRESTELTRILRSYLK